MDREVRSGLTASGYHEHGAYGQRALGAEPAAESYEREVRVCDDNDNAASSRPVAFVASPAASAGSSHGLRTVHRRIRARGLQQARYHFHAHASPNGQRRPQNAHPRNNATPAANAPMAKAITCQGNVPNTKNQPAPATIRGMGYSHTR